MLHGLQFRRSHGQPSSQVPTIVEGMMAHRRYGGLHISPVVRHRRLRQIRCVNESCRVLLLVQSAVDSGCLLKCVPLMRIPPGYRRNRAWGVRLVDVYYLPVHTRRMQHCRILQSARHAACIGVWRHVMCIQPRYRRDRVRASYLIDACCLHWHHCRLPRWRLLHSDTVAARVLKCSDVVCAPPRN